MEIYAMNGLPPIEKKFHPVIQFSVKDRLVRAEKTNQDKLELSNHGKDITHFMDLINAVPDVREFRVEEMHSAIESGAYNVKAEQVAQKIMVGDLLQEFF
jgi:flagellar biosynthesis anti-sigma factor FlgM